MLVMVAASLYRSLALGRQKGPLSPSQQKPSAGLLYLNMGLGVAVLLLSGGMAALGTGPALA
ncbi:MAG: hypothetical protein M5U14_19590 [Acidimicrobiia bacterium]|nr:hypothetical protein [Acidimicrobiia bacterium]